MWLIVDKTASPMKVTLDGKELKTVTGKEGAVTATIPAEIVAKPGKHAVRVVDAVTGQASDPVEFDVQ